MNDQTEAQLTSLSESWQQAKRDEALARDERIAIEQKIIDITGVREEGSQTHDAGEYKITVTGKITRTLDKKRWADIESSIPKALRPVTYEPKLELKGLRYLQNNEPDVYTTVCEAVSSKPAKPAVEVK